MIKDFEVYVINLEKDKDRLKRFSEVMYPIPYKRIEAVYGKDVDFTNMEEIFYTSRYLTPRSALGCGLSHRKALKTFLETSKKDYAVICEDDATPVNKETLEKDLEEIVNSAPKDWHIIKLDFFPLNTSNDFKQYYNSLTTSYLVNKEGAEKILAHQLFYHVDIDLNFYNINMYCNKEPIFVQIWDENNISNNRINHVLIDKVMPSEDSFLSVLPFKAIRIFDVEFTFAFLFLIVFLILLLVVLVYVVKNTKILKSTKKLFTRK